MSNNTLRPRVRRFVGWLLLGFIALFVFRLIYGYTKKVEALRPQPTFFENIRDLKRNYASKKYEKSTSGVAQTAIKVDQKYEKIAEIKTQSGTFENDERHARKLIEQYDGLIQFEQKSGNTGTRTLNLLIGVPPQNFDTLYETLIGIGRVLAKQITKKDKTNEYKELNAQKASLEKIRQSLIELKGKGGKIEEYMQLENRILEIEQQLQKLGVNLGDFDDENEFCTVQFSMIEGKDVQISFMHRVKVALEWTIKYYLRVLLTLFICVLFAYVTLLLLDKLKVIEAFFRQEK